MEPRERDALPTPPAGLEESGRFAVHISSVMLVIAMVAVCLGVLHEAPGLGILLIVLMVPALVRTLVGAARRKAKGHSMTPAEKLFTFFGSLGIVIVIGLAASIAFVTTCFPIGFLTFDMTNGAGVVLATIAGLAAAGYVLYLLGQRLWPQKDL
jgi:hypothetical protein